MTEHICEALYNLALRLEHSVNELEIAKRKNYDNILISCNEAARHLGCTSSTVTRMLKEGRLHRVAIGGSTGIRLSEILELKTP